MFKKSLFLMMVITLSLSIPCFSAQPLIGDVDGNQNINIVDALLIAQYTIHIPLTTFDESVADVNFDGSITIVDALLIAQYSVKIITEWPPVPIPTGKKLPGKIEAEDYDRLSCNDIVLCIHYRYIFLSCSSKTLYFRSGKQAAVHWQYHKAKSDLFGGYI